MAKQNKANMYQLTPRMLQSFELRKYHELFSKGRCAAWQQEELIVNAINADTQAQHHAFWSEAGHDAKADIRVRTNGSSHLIQIKSGQIKNQLIILSGHRLGRFKTNKKHITEYLNSIQANIIAIPYYKTDDQQGRTHTYEVCYIDVAHLKGLGHTKWLAKGKSYEQSNDFGVIFSLRPSMSWQIWWSIPLCLIKRTKKIVI